jgi:hypothetical protein
MPTHGQVRRPDLVLLTWPHGSDAAIEALVDAILASDRSLAIDDSI